MKMDYSKILAIVFMIAAFVGVSASNAFAEPNWSNNTIQATGVGAYPANAKNPAQARAMARRAAIVDAQRQLAEMVYGVNVDAETTVMNMITESDIVKTRVSAVLNGATVIDEHEISGGGYEVTMVMSMFGGNAPLAKAVIPEPPVRESFPTPTIQVQSSGGYTGVIVDCRGLGLKPVMSPVIKNDMGQPIYGYKNLDYDRVIDRGMASYSYDLSSGVERAGSNPIIVKATRLENHNGNPVISTADANRILSENNVSHFLESTNVVFIR